MKKKGKERGSTFPQIVCCTGNFRRNSLIIELIIIIPQSDVDFKKQLRHQMIFVLGRPCLILPATRMGGRRLISFNTSWSIVLDLECSSGNCFYTRHALSTLKSTMSLASTDGGQ